MQFEYKEIIRDFKLKVEKYRKEGYIVPDVVDEIINEVEVEYGK